MTKPVGSNVRKDEGFSRDLARIWRQTQTPIVHRRPDVALQVKLPYRDDNHSWLHRGRRSSPVWSAQYHCWLLPRTCFSEVTARILEEFGAVYVVQPHDEAEKCAPACWHAKRLECECSCLGVRHGSGTPEGQWYTVSDACAVSWRGVALRWSLLTRKPTTADPIRDHK